MPGFQAEHIVEPLDYDFRPYVQAHGTIPEPTDKQIAAFLRGLKEVVDVVQADLPDDVSADDPAAVLKAMDNLDPEKTIEQMGKMADVYAGLCSGTPTAEQISALPMRIRSIFFNWLQSEVMSPEAATPAGNGQVRTLPAARGA
jgi:hypothetical protein